MSSQANHAIPPGQTNTSSSSGQNGSSDLNFTSSGSNDPALLVQQPRSPSKSSFQWPSEPLNKGRPSLPQDSQQSVDDANRDISQRIADADQDATAQPSAHPGLEHPRLSAQLAATLNNLEDQRRHELSPTSTSFVVPSASTLPMLSPQPQSMNRTSSNGTNRSAGSDRADAPLPATQYSSFLPDIFRNAASMPLALLRSLIPDNAFATSTDEGLSASTLQVPVTSFNALFEACKVFEWLATQASEIETYDKASSSRRNSSAPQQSEDSVDFTCFDYLQLLQKVADVVSGLAASRGIDLILDLDPQLQGPPADNQRHYKLGSCAVWADRRALTFLFMSCISRLLHNAPVQSTVLITTTLTPKEENVVRPDSNPEMKLMVLSLGLRLILPRTVAASQDLMSSISGTPASLLLDAFGARLTAEQSTTQLPGSPDRAVVDHSISIPVGQLPDPQESPSDAQQQKSKASKHIASPSQDELVDFASTLKGNKVALYSTSQSLFARQLSSFLSGLGCDVAPVFTDSVDESSFDGNDHVFGKQAHTAVALTSGRPALVSYTSDIDKRVHPTQLSPPDGSTSAVQGKEGAQAESAVDTAVLDPVTGVPVTFDNSSYQPPASDQKPSQSGADNSPLTPETQIDPNGRRVVPFSYVIIDDDIVTLQKELLRIRSAVPLLKSALSSKSSPPNQAPKQLKASRPTLDHRTKSSPQVNRLMASQLDSSLSRSFGAAGSTLMKDGGETSESLDSIDESVSQTIIFFTSMKLYRLVRDTVQPIIDSASFRGVSSPPEIMVLPKPAGAKRILTALHAAQHKPVVQLPFLPIATAPLSPLTTHSKTWWTPNSSPQQDGQGIMTLARRRTGSTDTDFDTTPSTPWSPVEPIRAPGGLSTPEIPLTSENLPLAGEPSAKGASVRTVTKAVGAGASPSTSATTTKSAPRSNVSRQTGTNADPAATADAAVTHKSTPAGSVAGSIASAPASVHQSRSQGVSSPMPADALEYFSETAAKMGGSAASGMVIQSPDGRPAGIFFQPKTSVSTPSVAGSKPALSRGVSASSLRRGHPTPTEHSDRSESAARERRLMNRSNGSTSGSNRGSGTGNLASLAEHAAPANSTDAPAPQLQVPNAGKYPSGSIFAPQIGIHSVLNSSRPPMTTPLGPSLSSQPQDVAAGASGGSREAASAQDASERTNDDKQANGKVEASTAAGSTGSPAKAAKTAGFGPAKSGEGAAGRARSTAGEAHARQPAASGGDSATASPNARNSANAASRVKARQSFGAVTASPSDSKTKPSAVPQSGFMMGMGFTASARRGRGPKKAPVREAVLPPIKVLIVEDNPINQRILSMFMGKKKIKYDVANNGREAVEKWKTGGYHLILMDIQLPVMDGIEATKEIRKLERNANIGILPNTPPASTDSRVEPAQPTASSSLSGGSRTLHAKGLMKHAVAGSGDSASSSSNQPQQRTGAASGGPPASSSSSALVNGVGDANRVPTTTAARGGGSTNPFRASVIIVALTASVLSSDRVEALAAGCNDFLNKPVSLPWLNQKILEWGSMMYLMYSGLSSDDIHLGNVGSASGAAGAGVGRTERAQLHLGFGYGPAEKAKALANNLHLGDTLALKKKKRSEEKGRMEANLKGREANVEQRLQQRQQQQQQQQRKEGEGGSTAGDAPAESKDGDKREEKRTDAEAGASK
ncbi:related to SSK1-two-component signal transducer [Sporisorium reilianum SRZ2]|uniref:Related to SSK1-two-component signal transducer n=1 Tax=Sporisorium reilianum (strain SRZ2) TaxID=999809 RepID=E6ZJY7_SPORE|nr:related to SSK1-two-component signal transducer [Sporisorium reilianum SRZ2]